MSILEEIRQYWDEYPCGIQVTDEEWGSKAFFEDIKKKFHEHYAVYAHSDELLSFGSYRNKSVLEVGCGLGFDALEFAKVCARVTAIDLSPMNVKLARKYFEYNGVDATIEVGNAEQMRFSNDTFDLVVAIGVLYYTPNTQTAVDEIYRVLKPKGKAICMFFNRYSWFVLLSKISRTNLDHEEKDPPVLKLYSVKEVRRMFQMFSIAEIMLDRFPRKTVKRSGVIANLYNYGLVPLFNILPKAIIRPFGFHIIVEAMKSA